MAAGPCSVHHKPVSEGLTGKELVACLCGLAVTAAGPERKRAWSPILRKGKARSRLGKVQGCLAIAYEGCLQLLSGLGAAVGEGQKESGMVWPGRETRNTDVLPGARPSGN